MNDNRKAYSTLPKIKKLQWHAQHWESDLRYMEDEVSFVEQLLKADIYKPNTPNLFEKLQKYAARLGEFESRITRLRQLITEHQTLLAKVAKTDEKTVDSSTGHKHDDLEMEVLYCTDNFKELKAEIFNFLSSTLKKT